jgi:hypothetical protein
MAEKLLAVADVLEVNGRAHGKAREFFRFFPVYNATAIPRTRCLPPHPHHIHPNLSTCTQHDCTTPTTHRATQST